MTPELKRKASVLGILAFGALAWAAHENAYFSWDLRLSLAIQSVESETFRQWMAWVSLPGNGPWAYLVICSFAISWLLGSGRKREAAACGLSSGGGWLFTWAVKLLVARPRPASDLVAVYVTTVQSSFPSGHVVHYVTFYGFLLWIGMTRIHRNPIWLGIAGLAGVLVGLIGLSRVYLGAHWPSDVAGGYLMGYLWLQTSVRICFRDQST
ncbi:MAG: phosphatase PAP2 family protein [Acidobacteriota bacterium]